MVDDNFYEFQEFTLLPTSACNLRCKMCLAIRGTKATITREHALQAVDFAGRRGFKTIVVGGGEPLLVKYFYDLLDALVATGVEVRITTNGLLVTDEHIRRFTGHDKLSIQVSIDGIGEVHDEIRGARGAFDASEKSLRALAYAGIRISINTVVQRSNFRTMVDLYERFKDLPYMFHAFALVEPDEVISDQLLILPDELDEFTDVMTEVMSRGTRDGNDVILSPELLENYRRRVKYPYFLMHPGNGCTIGRRGLIVLPDGYVVPCFHYKWERERIQRRLGQRPIDDIVDSPEVRDDISRVVGPNGCRGCSTMCYNWDEDFREKVMRPTGLLRVRRAYLCAKEHVRINYPGVFAVAKRVRRRFRV